MRIVGKLNGIDMYGKIKLIIYNSRDLEYLNELINERYTKPYSIIYIDDVPYTQCYIIIKKYKEYYTELINNNIGKCAELDVEKKRYNFNEKKGTSLTLTNINILNI